MKKYSFIFVLLICYSVSYGQIIYLSPSGDDNNQGTAVRPLASLNGARDKIRELRSRENLRDTVFVSISGGTYYLHEPFVLMPEDSGTENAPVVFAGDDGNRPLFCGGMETASFEEVHPHLWRVFIPEVSRYGFYFEQLYINGERRFRAQTPNRGLFYNVKQCSETVLDDQGGRAPAFSTQKITPRNNEQAWLNDLQRDEWNDALIVFYHKWDNTRKRILHINAKDTALFTAGSGMQPWNRIDGESRYIVENYRKALDAPGEWFLQRDGWLYYIPMPGETPQNVKCIVPVTEKFIVVAGTPLQSVQHIHFQNIRFEAAAYNTPPEGNGAAQAAAPIEAAIMIDHAKHIGFFNCDVAHTGLHGIWFRNKCSYGKVEHCHLSDLGGGGVKIGTTSMPRNEDVTSHITIHNNIIHHGGYVFPCAVGVIIFNGSDNQITHNEIADFRYSGVSVGWVWGYSHSPSKRNRIDYNHIHHLGWGELSDMGGVYTLGASEGTTVNNNVIHHIFSYSYGGWGLYTDEGSYDVHMENNLVYKCKNAGFHQHYGKENVIRNNIFALNLLSQLQFTRVEEHLSLSFTHNIVYYDEGLLYMSMGKDAWLNADVNIDYNCYWDTRTRTPDFHGMPFAEWKQKKRDQHSIIADPLFVNPQQFDFRFRNRSVAKKIKFEPFDYSQAGVYGSQEWINKAKMSDKLAGEFDKTVETILLKQ